MRDDKTDNGAPEASDESLMKFPCEFSVKAMGKNEAGFDGLVVELMKAHCEIPEGAVKVRPSANDNYLSVTVTITAESKEQMDKIYQALSDHDKVIMAL
ncbi:MAG TPA: DUF493 domain-containing protein [Chromatiaceae bacterium]|nr:DUF493 domain-containing protein [Chromatiaceae bacterium]